MMEKVEKSLTLKVHDANIILLHAYVVMVELYGAWGQESCSSFLKTCIIPCHKDQYSQIQDGLQPVRPPELNFSACKYPVPPFKGGYIIQEGDTSSSST
jgi:hypothetical protein